MIHVLHTDSFVSYYPRYQINNMKAKLSENILFGDSDRGEIGGGGALPQGHPEQKPEIPHHRWLVAARVCYFFFLHPP